VARRTQIVTTADGESVVQGPLEVAASVWVGNETLPVGTRVRKHVERRSLDGGVTTRFESSSDGKAWTKRTCAGVIRTRYVGLPETPRRAAQPNAKRKSPVVSVSVSPEERIALEEIAAARGLSVSRAVGALATEEQRRQKRRGRQ